MCTLYKHLKVTGQTQVIISSVLRANIRKMQIAKNSKYCKNKKKSMSCDICCFAYMYTICKIQHWPKLSFLFFLFFSKYVSVILRWWKILGRAIKLLYGPFLNLKTILFTIHVTNVRFYFLQKMYNGHLFNNLPVLAFSSFWQVHLF